MGKDMVVQFDDLEKADLIVDCVYKGGSAPNLSAEPFHKLIPGCENSGGFRKKLREDGSGKYDKANRGKIGQLIERYYFHHECNNDSNPDFIEAGVELTYFS